MKRISLKTKTFDDACKERQEHWVDIDELLYKRCRRWPGHSNYGQVRAKLKRIDLNYGTRIAYFMKPGKASAMERLTKQVKKERQEVDSIFKHIKAIKELTEPSLKRIVVEHGRFVKLLKPLMRKRMTLRSFVSKYMHFHNPAVPVYDSIACAAAKKLVPGSYKKVKLFEFPKGADREYWLFVCRFRKIYDHIRQYRPKATVKEVDCSLLYLPWQS